MDVHFDTSGERIVARPSGRIGSTEAAAFTETLLTAVRGHAKALDVDFSNVLYISSAGLRALISAAHELGARSQRLRVIHPTREVLMVLRVARFDEFVDIVT